MNSAKFIRFPWKIGTGDNKSTVNQSGFLQMKKGTYDYLFPLGVGEGEPGDLTGERQQTAKTYDRHQYPGGPIIKVTRTAKTVTFTRSGRPSTAKSEKKLILTETGTLGSSQDTIYYTGNTYAVITWLKSFSSVLVGNGVQISGPKGQKYVTLDPAVTVPII